MARDWSFAPASFRGATFYVDTGAPSGGRRKVIHEYPSSDKWDVEDLGSKAKKVTLTAYCIGEQADADYAALIAACDQAGPGELLVPFFGTVQASAETWDPSWQQEALNKVSGSFVFIVENPANAPVAFGLGARILAGQLADATSTIGAAVTALFAGVPATSYQRSDAAGALADTAALVETIRQSTVLPDATAAAAQVALATLLPTAATAAEVDPGRFVAAALATLDAVAIDADPVEAAPMMATAAALAATMVSPSLVGQPSAGQAAMAIPAALAVAVAMQAMRLTATVTYTDRRAAVAARTAIGAVAASTLPVVGALGADVTTAFLDVWGQAAAYLSSAVANLAPVVVYGINLSLPSTVLAYRLYGDPARAADLVARNRVTTPLIMPTIFEAATR